MAQTALALAAATLAAAILNPAVTPATVDATICVPGWTQRERPRAGYVAALERAMLPADADPRDYVMDHVMPLGLGGHPSASANLRPQRIAEAAAKDIDERRLNRAVCAGRISLPAAQAQMRRIWP